MNGDRKNLKEKTAMYAISPLRNRFVVACLVTTCVSTWALWALDQSPVVAQEKALQADAKKSRIFLSALARAKGKENEKFVNVLLALDPATGKCVKVCDSPAFLHGRPGPVVWPRVSPDGQTLVFTNQERDEL
jgi:hypothetical protein